MTEKDRERLEKLKADNTLEEREIANMVNSAFFLYEGADMLIRAAERRFKKKGSALRHKQKELFTKISKAVTHLEYLVLQFQPYYDESYEDKIGEKYCNIQKAADFYSQFALLAGDRLSTEEKEKKLLNYVRKFKPNGWISEETLSEVKLKL